MRLVLYSQPSNYRSNLLFLSESESTRESVRARERERYSEIVLRESERARERGFERERERERDERNFAANTLEFFYFFCHFFKPAC